MKKIIFLVDTKDSKFLIINTKGKWELPSLKLEGEYNNDFICEKYKQKYNHNIRNVIIIEEDDKCIFVKCITDNIFSDASKYRIDVVNEIMQLITNKLHYHLLLNLLTNIGFEILNDSFWLGIVLTTEDKIQDLTMKALLTDFLLFFSSSFCEELITYKFGEIKNPRYVSNIELKNLRKRYFKKCPLYKSKDIEQIIQEMGIDFDNYNFDNVLFYIEDELIDINSRTWINRNKEYFDLYSGIILTPRRWIENYFPQLHDIFEELRKPFVDEFVERFSKKNILFKTYSSHKLFIDNLSNDEKIYIMQRFGLLRTVMFFTQTFGNGNFIVLNEEKQIKINFDIFILKVKAQLIELLWNDNLQNDIPFLKKILENYPKDIEKEFFQINRKCRDNLHYGFYNKLNDDELLLLHKNQDKYLNYVIKEFEKQLHIKYGLGYHIGLTIAKVQHWASN